jgi:hypothetical protein
MLDAWLAIMLEALLAIAESLVCLPDLFTKTGVKFGCALAMLLMIAVIMFAVYFWTI